LKEITTHQENWDRDADCQAQAEVFGQICSVWQCIMSTVRSCWQCV